METLKNPKTGEVIAAGAPHFQWNPGEVAVRAVEEYRPAGRLHAMFATFFRLAGAGRLNGGGRVVAPLTRVLGSNKTVRRLNPERAGR